MPHAGKGFLRRLPGKPLHADVQAGVDERQHLTGIVRTPFRLIFLHKSKAMEEQPRSLFRVGVQDEYVHVIDDVIRLVLIQVVVQMMFYLNSPGDFPFFSPTFVAVVLYIIIAVSAYWLVFRKVILFVPRLNRPQHSGNAE